MASRRFIQCDVFTSTPTKGNGLAVVVDADGMTDTQMQDFAAWTNLAETTFLLAPRASSADYRVRIFTPSYEMPFAGHPTLGSCAAWIRTGGVPDRDGIVVQECGVGLIDIDLTGDAPAFIAPPTKIEPLAAESLGEIVTALEVHPETVVRTAKLNNGPVWQVLELKDANAVLAIDSSKVRWPTFHSIGLIGAHPAGAECQYEVRMLAPSSGMSEDPITGSLNAAIAHWMLSEGRLSSAFVVSQGTKIDRDGRVFIRPSSSYPGKVLIGGHTQILIEGTLEI